MEHDNIVWNLLALKDERDNKRRGVSDWRGSVFLRIYVRSSCDSTIQPVDSNNLYGAIDVSQDHLVSEVQRNIPNNVLPRDTEGGG